MRRYPKNMRIKTFTQDCFDGATETPEAIKLKEKYLPKMHDLSEEFTEDCIKNHIESMSSVGFFFAWLYAEFIETHIKVVYSHLHEAEGGAERSYEFGIVDKTK